MIDKIKIPRPVDPIGSTLFDAIFGSDKKEGEIEVGPEKAKEVGDNIKGLFTLSSKLGELGETLKESNDLLKEANKLIIKTNAILAVLEEKLLK